MSHIRKIHMKYIIRFYDHLQKADPIQRSTSCPVEYDATETLV